MIINLYIILTNRDILVYNFTFVYGKQRYDGLNNDEIKIGNCYDNFISLGVYWPGWFKFRGK